MSKGKQGCSSPKPRARDPKKERLKSERDLITGFFLRQKQKTEVAPHQNQGQDTRKGNTEK